MSLPKVKVPMFSVVIPSLQKKVLLKSMTTKEYKLLLIAKENKNREHELVTIRQVLGNCITDKKIDIDKLALYDVEFLFVKLMGASTAERFVKLAYRCRNKITGADDQLVECNEINRVAPDMHLVEIANTENKELNIEVDTEEAGKVVLTFTHPTLGSAMNMSGSTEMDITGNCLTKVTSTDEVQLLGRDYTIDEANELVNEMSEVDLKKILEFISAAPTLYLKHQFKCKKCKFDHTIELKGIRDFFI